MQQNPQAEFNKYHDRYNQLVSDAISFSGLKVDFFTRVKTHYLLQVITDRFGTCDHVSALDVGCGIGNTLALLVGKLERLAGVDVSETCIEVARRNAPGADCTAYDGVHVPHENSSFDVVFSICVFHHVPVADRLPLAREIKRVLKPGGIFMIFEHNPRNRITTHIVNTCEFDRNAILLRSLEAEALMLAAGFDNVLSRFILTVRPRARFCAVLIRYSPGFH